MLESGQAEDRLRHDWGLVWGWAGLVGGWAGGLHREKKKQELPNFTTSVGQTSQRRG